ncbi:unnamed protein product [Bursaphelenchus okinawaensis]|uniref:Uncharacterized protein n=1 Tax=Bursaphelenchus okinawaensis TaxID=465554 RepID=A0A811LE39_9BILA|nr:unnamed protein product [Bursaphelenchus okinawaensis]CAG9121529.1 unnamed protein product [Bursaphelenchus okinawaensis]
MVGKTCVASSTTIDALGAAFEAMPPRICYWPRRMRLSDRDELRKSVLKEAQQDADDEAFLFDLMREPTQTAAKTEEVLTNHDECIRSNNEEDSFLISTSSSRKRTASTSPKRAITKQRRFA